MTTATQTRSWQREPVGDPAPPDGPPAAPSLFPLLDWLVTVHGGKSLSVNDLWHDRPVRGGSVPSSHRGAAFDWRYEDPGKGRQYMLTNVLPDLTGSSLELNVQQIHDYVGCRVWKASRSGDSSGGWARQNPGSHSGMMGAPWAQWLHVEAGEWAWNDDRPVPDKLGPVPEERQEEDMLMLARGSDGSNWVIGSELTRLAVWPDDWDAMLNAKVAVEVGLRGDTVDRIPQAGQTDVIGDQARRRLMLADCVEASGYRMPGGYGKATYEGKQQLAHRVAWQRAFGPIPEGLEVMHLCDNPACVNLNHLVLGTHAANMADMKAKRRHRPWVDLQDRCKHGHPFDEENTSWGERHGYRVRRCRACRREQFHRRSHK